VPRTTSPGRDIGVVAVGDAINAHRMLPHDHPGDPGFSGLCELIRSADVASVNLETNVFEPRSFEGWPSLDRGGSFLVGEPFILDELEAMGFNLYARGNNHAGDWGIEGMLATTEELDARGLLHAGIGTHLAEATRATYLDTAKGRVAMVSVTTTFPKTTIAGPQRPDTRGRPGCNGIHIHRTLHLPAASLADVQRALDDYGESGTIKRMGLGLAEGPEPAIVDAPDEDDIGRNLEEIEKAAAFADLVLVNAHTHEPGNDVTDVTPWLADFARRCIEAGAHAYLGHGPHQLRGAEIHEGRPIFYSLGNFVFHRDAQDPVPAEQYSAFGLDPQRTRPDQYVAARDGSGDRLGMTRDVFYEAVAPRMRFDGGRLTDLVFHAIELGHEQPIGSRGTPRLAGGEHGARILERYAELTSAFDLRFEIDGGCGTWHR
jgi:poly-gamma-glutamate capsule biosynthesis protein CapA/YwtB (metallophosphatase superfamily)